MVTYTICTSQTELKQILALQQQNLPKQLSSKEIQREGFVTVEHTLELLERMNSPFPHIIAKSNDQVVGYTLVMLKELATEITILQPMFEIIDQTEYKGKALKDSAYFTMGQVCVAKSHRGQGVFAGLYEHMKTMMSKHFDYLITIISPENKRSLRAHQKVGFTQILEYSTSDQHHWVMVLLALKNQESIS